MISRFPYCNTKRRDSFSYLRLLRKDCNILLLRGSEKVGALCDLSTTFIKASQCSNMSDKSKDKPLKISAIRVLRSAVQSSVTDENVLQSIWILDFVPCNCILSNSTEDQRWKFFLQWMKDGEREAEAEF